MDLYIVNGRAYFGAARAIAAAAKEAARVGDAVAVYAMGVDDEQTPTPVQVMSVHHDGREEMNDALPLDWTPVQVGK